MSGICAVTRPLPVLGAASGGWRCSGMSAGRVCEDRRRNSGAFGCKDGECVQAKPRMPDDGEWECVEMDAVVFCRWRADAAGMVAGPADVGWLCGDRRSHDGERVCIDLSPDRPGPETDWRCDFQYVGGDVTRRCRRPAGVVVGGTCSDALRCPSGSECVGGHCLPARPMPACWLDADCGHGVHCRWGTCMPGSP